MKKVKTFSLDIENINFLNEKASAEGRSTSNLLNNILKDLSKQNKKRKEIVK